MASEHLYTYSNPPRIRDLEKITETLKRDGVIAIPTDSAWAFACDAANPRAIDKIRRLKPQHPKEQSFSLICSDISMASEYALIDNDVYPFLKKAWPGAFTILLPRTKNLTRQLKDKRAVVGIRIPAHIWLIAFVKFYTKPLATTTVPLVEDKALKFGYEVFECFGHGLDLCVDLGEECLGLETTILDLCDFPPKLIRQGLGDSHLFGI